MVRFGVLNVPNLTISQIQFGISQVRFGTDHPKSKFQFGMSQIEIPIWDIPGLIWDMVKFGLQHDYDYNLNITFFINVCGPINAFWYNLR